MNLRASDSTPGTRERILDVAERLFADQGFAATSVRQITDAAEANLGAINYYFRSKEHLYIEVFSRRVALIRDPVLAAVEEATDLAGMSPELAFLTLGRSFLGLHAHCNSRYLIGLFAREVIDPRLPPRLFEREFLTPIIEAIADVARRARPDLTESVVKECAHAFFAQVIHIVKGAEFEVTPVETRLEHAVRFTVAAVMNIEAVPHGRSRHERQRKPS